MPEGYVKLIGPSRQVLVRLVAERRRERVAAAAPDLAYRGADVAPRPTVRMEAFDFGDAPLPGWSATGR